jgi:hypothetical protein
MTCNPLNLLEPCNCLTIGAYGLDTVQPLKPAGRRRRSGLYSLDLDKVRAKLEPRKEPYWATDTAQMRNSTPRSTPITVGLIGTGTATRA